MFSKYSVEIDNQLIDNNLHRLIGQTYKLLPYREEGIDWVKPLITIQNELAGMYSLFADNEEFGTILLSLQCKLEGLLSGSAKDNFDEFRGCVFECIGKIKVLKDLCQD